MTRQVMGSMTPMTERQTVEQVLKAKQLARAVVSVLFTWMLTTSRGVRSSWLTLGLVWLGCALLRVPRAKTQSNACTIERELVRASPGLNGWCLGDSPPFASTKPRAGGNKGCSSGS